MKKEYKLALIIGISCLVLLVFGIGAGMVVSSFMDNVTKQEEVFVEQDPAPGFEYEEETTTGDIDAAYVFIKEIVDAYFADGGTDYVVRKEGNTINVIFVLPNDAIATADKATMDAIAEDMRVITEESIIVLKDRGITGVNVALALINSDTDELVVYAKNGELQLRHYDVQLKMQFN